ncbi:hypothetical protein KA344_01770 [bacterium]|nr:hypothetical protein [bacterium]
MTDQYDEGGVKTALGNHRTALIAVASTFVFGLLFHMFTFAVPAGNSAFLNFMGSMKIEKRYGPGLHFKWPLVESVQLYPSRTSAENHTSQPRDNTQQVLTADWSVELFVHPEYSGALLKEIGNFEALKQKILDPLIQTSAQAETPTYSPEDLVKKRPQLVANIQSRLQTAVDARLAEYKVPAGAVQIIQIACLDFKFSDPFNKSVEAKVEQEQKRLTAEIIKQIDIIQADADGQSKEIEGKAKATSTKLLGDANAYAIEKMGAASRLNTLLAPFIQLEKWDGEPSTTDLPEGGHTSVILAPASKSTPVNAAPANDQPSN